MSQDEAQQHDETKYWYCRWAMENDRPTVKVTSSIVPEVRRGMEMTGDRVDLVWCRIRSDTVPTVEEAMVHLQRYISILLPHPSEPESTYRRTYTLADGSKVVVTINKDSFRIVTVGGEHE